MSSKRALKRAQHVGKIKHTKEGAAYAVVLLRRKHVGEQYDAYPCSHCGGWHVGHRTQKARQQIAARKRREA